MKYLTQFVAEYENTLGEIYYLDIESSCIEDATIEATNKAEENGSVLLSVDYANKNL